MPKTKLSREALAAAPWAAKLAASFPPEPIEVGLGAASSSSSKRQQVARSKTPQELEEDVHRETMDLLAARASSASTATTSSASLLIPTFFRSRSQASFLAAELRSAAHRVALQYKERGLLEDDELEDLWNCITRAIQRRPPEPSSSSSSSGGGGGGLLAGLPPIAAADTAALADAESRVSYDELCEVRDEFAARLDGAAAAGGGAGAGGGVGGGGVGLGGCGGRAPTSTSSDVGGGGASRIAHYFSAKTFNRFKRDANGRINGRTFMEFVVRHVALTQSRINLGCHDADADGWLTEEELEAFVSRSVTTMAALQSLTNGFMKQYCRIATRRFMFFNDPQRRGKARISKLLAGDALADFNELHAAREDDPQLAKNWFSLASAQRVYKSYLDLDLDMNGTLSKDEFKRYTFDMRIADQCNAQGLTEVFTDRLFEEHSLKGPESLRAAKAAAGRVNPAQTDPFVAKSLERRRKQITEEMDFQAFLDFVLAWSNKNHPASLAYFFRILDINKTGSLTNMEIWTFLKSVHKTWIADPDNYDLNMLDVRDEIFDMVKPAQDGRITLEDLQRCGCAHTVFEILCDHTGFWRYDNRESLPHDDDDDEEGEGEGGEEDEDEIELVDDDGTTMPSDF